MGNPLFGINISGLINQHIAPGLLPLRLHVLSVIDNDTDPTAATTSNFTTRSGRGLITDYEASQIDGTLIQEGDVKILIIGDSLPRNFIPQVDSEVTIENTRYRLKQPISRDPAAATYVCNANPI